MRGEHAMVRQQRPAWRRHRPYARRAFCGEAYRRHHRIRIREKPAATVASVDGSGTATALMVNPTGEGPAGPNGSEFTASHTSTFGPLGSPETVPSPHRLLVVS